jgi:hypothetical protein
MDRDGKEQGSRDPGTRATFLAGCEGVGTHFCRNQPLIGCRLSAARGSGAPTCLLANRSSTVEHGPLSNVRTLARVVRGDLAALASGNLTSHLPDGEKRMSTRKSANHELEKRRFFFLQFLRCPCHFHCRPNDTFDVSRLQFLKPVGRTNTAHPAHLSSSNVGGSAT